MDYTFNLKISIIAVTVSFLHSIMIVRKEKILGLIEPAIITHFFFILTFYIPFIFLPHYISWLSYSKELVLYALFGHISMTFAFILIKVLWPSNKQINFSHVAIGDSLLIFLWLLGISVYAAIFLIIGVPALTSDVEIARAQFASGKGIFIWPALISINVSTWMVIIKKRYAIGVILGLIGSLVILLSGWRSNILHTVIGVIVIICFSKISLKKMEIAKVMKLIFIIFLTFLLVGVLGIVRSKISGIAVYGLFVEDITTAFGYISYGFMNIVSRFGAYPRNFDLVIDHFESTPFFYGKGILMDLSFFIPGQTETIVFYFRNQFGNWIGGGGMPATMLGAFYLDFGVWGVVFMGGLAAASFALMFQIAKYKISNYSLKIILIAILHISWLFGLQGTYFAYFLPILIMYCFMIYIYIFMIKIKLPRSYKPMKRF